MTKKIILTIIAVLLCLIVNAQIYSQGKNINILNDTSIYFIQVALIQQPLTIRYYGELYFHNKPSNIHYYIKNKSGVEHKTFLNESELISYMNENEWLYISSEGNKYSFRKSMKYLH